MATDHQHQRAQQRIVRTGVALALALSCLISAVYAENMKQHDKTSGTGLAKTAGKADEAGDGFSGYPRISNRMQVTSHPAAGNRDTVQSVQTVAPRETVRSRQ